MSEETPFRFNTVKDIAKMALIEKLTCERDEALEQLEHERNPIHSCGDSCQRTACVMRRQRDEAREMAARLREEMVRANVLFAHGVGSMSSDESNRDRNIASARKIHESVRAALIAYRAFAATFQKPEQP